MPTPHINPFHDSYSTEILSEGQYVKLFSPILVKSMMGIFGSGNVVVRGVQGSGKTMILSLLSPKIRLAYQKAGEDFPVPEQLRNFIGAYFNLTHEGATDFGQRAFAQDEEKAHGSAPIYFGDYLNYSIVERILKSIELLSTDGEGKIGEEIGLDFSAEKIDRFVESLSQDECWLGYFSEVRSYEELKIAIKEREAYYRNFLQWNIDALPDSINATKTSIGEPIGRTVEHLRAVGIVSQTTLFFIQIDQYETLLDIGESEGEDSSLGEKFRQVVNKLLQKRDARVFYRIGTRLHAWQRDLRVYGTNSKLEEERDYKAIEIDEILKRKENRSTTVFPEFARDVFDRRMKSAQYVRLPNSVDTKKKYFLDVVLGNTLTDDELVKSYNKTGKGVISSKKMLSPEWFKFLNELAKENALSAKLGEAWVRQQKKQTTPPVDFSHLPWENKAWWKKERKHLALMQIAAQNGQRMFWSGAEDVIQLSGGNIHILVTICQHIWTDWQGSIRGTKKEDVDTDIVPTIPSLIQATGIHSASSKWHRKILEQSGACRARQIFADLVSGMMRNTMLEDKSMSYPGHNGFSLRLHQLDSHTQLRRFLDDAVDYSVLVDAPHTSKSREREPRRKWYLVPILSPLYQIPEEHVKEPVYAEADQVDKWMRRAYGSEDAISIFPLTRQRKIVEFEQAQLSFFTLEGELFGN